MKVFISHSGTRSVQLAKLFQEWLPNVIQNVEPWISDDIKKGKLWRTEISSALEDTKIGIICLTQTNLLSPWILFEAGALSKTHDAIVSTFLLDNEPSDIKGPLADFQHTVFEKEDIRKLISGINEQLKLAHEKPLSQNRLNKAFEKYWNEFEDPAKEVKSAKEGNEEIKRTKREREDILEEILDRLRRMEAIQNIPEIRYQKSYPAIELHLDNKKQRGSKIIFDSYKGKERIIFSLEGQLAKEKDRFIKMKKMKTDSVSLTIQEAKISELEQKIRDIYEYSVVNF